MNLATMERRSDGVSRQRRRSFAAADEPLGYFDGPNVYGVEKENPVGGTDPSGLAVSEAKEYAGEFPKGNDGIGLDGKTPLRQDSPIFDAVFVWYKGPHRDTYKNASPLVQPFDKQCDKGDVRIHIRSVQVRKDTVDSDTKMNKRDKFLVLLFSYKYKKAPPARGEFDPPPDTHVRVASKEITFVHYVVSGTIYWKCNGKTWSSDFSGDDTEIHLPLDSKEYYEAVADVEKQYRDYFNSNQDRVPDSVPKLGELYDDKSNFMSPSAVPHAVAPQ